MMLALYTEAAKRGWVIEKWCSEEPFKGKRLRTTSAMQKKQVEKNAAWRAVINHYSTMPFPAELYNPDGGV